MATRTYCDNCGNTVRSPHKYAFGAHYNFTQNFGGPGTLVMAPGGGGGVGVQQALYYTNPAANPVARPAASDDFIIIDLCDRCRPIWMNRVKALTESSEPDAVNGS